MAMPANRVFEKVGKFVSNPVNIHSNIQIKVKQTSTGYFYNLT